jgi:hypothetical protein|tara:strand:- start:1612 stop:1911 length:300 start_codon:yes stop_codon:yes gene_type:complete
MPQEEQPAPEQEQEKKEEQKEESPSAMEEAKLLLEGLKTQNEIAHKILSENQKLHSEQLLSGHAIAGVPNQTKEQKAIANARAYLEGTGFEDELFPLAK